MATLIGAKGKTQYIEVETVREVIVTPTPTPSMHIIDRENTVETVSPNMATPTPAAPNPWIGNAQNSPDASVPNPDYPEESAMLSADNGKRLYRATCYIATGSCCADGTMPREGICAGAWFRIGQDCLIYDAQTGELIERLECRDTGGHWMLQNDTAIDIYKDSYDRAVSHIQQHGDYVLVEWLERGTE